MDTEYGASVIFPFTRIGTVGCWYYLKFLVKKVGIPCHLINCTRSSQLPRPPRQQFWTHRGVEVAIHTDFLGNVYRR